MVGQAAVEDIRQKKRSRRARIKRAQSRATGLVTLRAIHIEVGARSRLDRSREIVRRHQCRQARRIEVPRRFEITRLHERSDDVRASVGKWKIAIELAGVETQSVAAGARVTGLTFTPT